MSISKFRRLSFAKSSSTVSGTGVRPSVKTGWKDFDAIENDADTEFKPINMQWRDRNP